MLEGLVKDAILLVKHWNVHDPVAHFSQDQFIVDVKMVYLVGSHGIGAAREPAGNVQQNKLKIP